MKWYKFDPDRGSRQKRPPEKKWVLVMCEPAQSSSPRGIGVGYMKNAAGDKQSPYFVIPGLFPYGGSVVAWSDSLPEGWEWPKDLNRESQ
jgi:hypothetical protein